MSSKINIADDRSLILYIDQPDPLTQRSAIGDRRSHSCRRRQTLLGKHGGFLEMFPDGIVFNSYY